MKIQERLKTLIEENGGNLSKLHRKVRELFEEQSIAYLTLYRTVHGLTEVREATLFQIASALGTTTDELKKGTEREEKTSRYAYNPQAYLETDNHGLPFLTGRLVLLPGAKTQTEQDPAEKGSFFKWLYGLSGEIICVVETAEGIKELPVSRNKSASFDSTKPHHFENRCGHKSSCVIIQDPKYI